MSMSYAGEPMVNLGNIGNSMPTELQYAILGRMIAGCASVETSLHSLLKHLLDIDDQIARLLVGERRIGDMVDVLKSIARLRKVDDVNLAHLTAMLTKVEFINSVRSVVAHKPFVKAGDAFTFHNAHTAKDAAKIWQYKCTNEQLENCAELASRLGLALLCFPFPKDPAFPGEQKWFEEKLQTLSEIQVLPAIPKIIDPPSQKPRKRPPQP